MLRTTGQLWEALRTSFWFLPALMTVLASVLALAAVRLDEAVPQAWIGKWGWLYSGGAEGGRQLLAAVAGSMITVAGVVFSITIVALTLASTQFGPRLLRNFMRDRGNQVVLGTFIATFVYCLLVLRTVRGENGDMVAFVPHVSITLAIVLALMSLGVLIFFIHHAAVSMQAPMVIANVSAELQAVIDAMFPEELEDGKLEPDENEGQAEGALLPASFEQQAVRLCAAKAGYLQFVDQERLLKLAMKQEAVVRLERRPGHFLAVGETLAVVAAGGTAAADRLVETMDNAFVLGPQQTPTQDVEFAMNQLVEVAVRALSPGVNDPFTAMTCVDQLGAALSRLATRRIPFKTRRDRHGRVRLIVPGLTFADLADTAFRQIRQYGSGSTAVLARMLEAIEVILKRVRRADDRNELLRQVRLIAQAAEGLPHAADRADVERRYRRIIEHSDPLPRG